MIFAHDPLVIPGKIHENSNFTFGSKDVSSQSGMESSEKRYNVLLENSSN